MEGRGGPGALEDAQDGWEEEEWSPGSQGGGPGQRGEAQDQDATGGLGDGWKLLACGHCGLWLLAASRLCSPACPCLWLLLIQSPPCSVPTDKGDVGGTPGVFVVPTSLGKNVRMSLVTVPQAWPRPSVSCLLIFRRGSLGSLL